MKLSTTTSVCSREELYVEGVEGVVETEARSLPREG